MIREYTDLDKLLWGTIRAMFRDEPGAVDLVTSSEAICYDNLLSAQSMRFSLDIGTDLGFRQSRWSKLVRQYLDPLDTNKFLRSSRAIALGETKRGAVAGLATRKIRGSDLQHRFGGCIIGFTFRGTREEPILSLYSRTAYIGYVGAIDLAVAYVLAREIGWRIERPAKDFQFRWHSTSLQLHGLKSLPLLWNREPFMSPLKAELSRQRNRVQKLLGAQQDALEFDRPSNFGPFRRVKELYRRHVAGEERDSVPIEDLSLDCLCRV